MKNMNHSWGTIQRLASDRQVWGSFIASLHTSWRDDSDDDEHVQIKK